MRLAETDKELAKCKTKTARAEKETCRMMERSRRGRRRRGSGC
jgi:hypothetical protein